MSVHGDGRNNGSILAEHWAPNAITTDDVVDPTSVRALAALFDNGLEVPLPGDELPPLWHWVALSRWTASSELGPDGHPVRGSFLPPIDLPRRMFAGGEVVLHSPLVVGEAVQCRSTVESVTEKEGRTGKLVVVVVATTIDAHDGRLAIEERQNLIYRGAGHPAGAATAPAEIAPVGRPFHRSGDWTWEFATDPALLMRFSAATSNTHRIHYDWPYATLIEGYPGLVVHGPLMTLALTETVRLQGLAGQIRRVRHRNLKPLFCAEPAELRRVGHDSANINLALYGRGEPDPCVSVEVELAVAHPEGQT